MAGQKRRKRNERKEYLTPAFHDPISLWAVETQTRVTSEVDIVVNTWMSKALHTMKISAQGSGRRDRAQLCMRIDFQHTAATKSGNPWNTQTTQALTGLKLNGNFWRIDKAIAKSGLSLNSKNAA